MIPAMMTKTKATLAIAAALLAGATMGAPLAAADTQTTTTTMGQPTEVVNGDVAQSWTVTGLRPSSDAIPYPVRGTLWEAAAADTALRGEVKPIIPFLNARAADGETYRVLWEVATPQGVNPSTLQPGQTAAGKVYFDVTGAPPNSVVYNDGEQDLAVWLPAPPATAGTSGGGSGAAASAVPTGTGQDALAPAEVSTGTPVPAATDATGQAPAAVSQGTPVGEGAAEAATPAVEGGAPATAAAIGSDGQPATAPVAGSEGTPASTGTPAATTPAPATAAGTPATPAPAATSEGTLPAGSQGEAATAPTPSTGTTVPMQ